MLKLNKSVHFNILCIFAVVFVCVYLYYTIVDVKKIAVEVKKHNQDIQNIVASLGALTQAVSDLKKKAAPCTTANFCKLPVVDVTAATVDDDSVNTEDVKTLLEDIPDDDVDVQAVPRTQPRVQPEFESVPELEHEIEHELEHEIEPEPERDEADDLIESIRMKEAPKDYKSMSADELKSERYEDLKDHCKRSNISSKGTKEAIIQRILAEANHG